MSTVLLLVAIGLAALVLATLLQHPAFRIVLRQSPTRDGQRHPAVDASGPSVPNGGEIRDAQIFRSIKAVNSPHERRVRADFQRRGNGR